jgi:hypothetical protein
VIRTYTLIVTVADDNAPSAQEVASRVLGSVDFASSSGGPFHATRWPNLWIDAAEGDRTSAQGDPFFAGAKDLHQRLSLTLHPQGD